MPELWHTLQCILNLLSFTVIVRLRANKSRANHHLAKIFPARAHHIRGAGKVRKRKAVSDQRLGAEIAVQEGGDRFRPVIFRLAMKTRIPRAVYHKLFPQYPLINVLCDAHVRARIAYEHDRATRAHGPYAVRHGADVAGSVYANIRAQAARKFLYPRRRVLFPDVEKVAKSEKAGRFRLRGPRSGEKYVFGAADPCRRSA